MFEKFVNALKALFGVAPVTVEAEAAVDVDAPVEMLVDAPAEPVVAPEVLGAQLSLPLVAYHVEPLGAEWAIKAPGHDAAVAVHAKKKDAVASATKMAKAAKGELFVHGKNGKIQSRNSYGNDSSHRKG